MTPLLDFLLDATRALGAWSLGALWLPLLAWTLAVLPALALLRARPPHPLTGYRARQALLFALPLGLALAAATDWGLPLFSAAPPPAVHVSLGPPAALAPTVGPAAPAWPALTWMHALGALTLAAALLAVGRLARLAVSACRLARYRRSLSVGVSRSTRRLARNTADRLGLRRRFRIARAPATAPPMTLGLLRPVVALPAGLGGERLAMALAHECVHLRRRDDYAAWGEALVGALFFLHPLCALLRRRIAAAREAACDAAVLEGRRFSPRRYAQMLLDLSAPAPTPPALALSLAAPHRSLPSRLRAMKDPTAPAPRFTLVLATALLALPLLLMACADLTAPADSHPAAAATPQRATTSDSTMTQWITSVDVKKGTSEGAVIDLHVKPDTPSRVRARLRRQVRKNQGIDAVTVSDASDSELEADFQRSGQGKTASGTPDGLTITSAPNSDRKATSHHLKDIRSHRPNGRTISIPDSSMSDRAASFIQSIEINKPDQGPGEMRVILKPGTPNAERERIREHVRHQIQESQTGLNVTFGTTTSDAPASNQGSPHGGPSVNLSRSGIALKPASRKPKDAVRPAARDTVDFAAVDEKPEIVGGPQALYDAVQYPEAARADSLEGTVYVQFVVGEDGQVRAAKVLRGAAAPLDGAALRAIRSLTFRPAKKGGRPVPVRMTQPVRFKL